MIKASQKQFNIFTFVIKAVLALFSIVVSLFLCYFFEQEGITIQVQGLPFKVENAFNKLNVNNFNFKGVERVLSSGLLFLAFIIKMCLAFFLLFALIYSSVRLVAYVLRSLTVKSEETQKLTSEAQENYGLVKSAETNFYDTIKNLNLTLNI